MIKSLLKIENIKSLKIDHKKFFVENESFSILNICKKIFNHENNIMKPVVIFTPISLPVGANSILEKSPMKKVTWDYSFKWKPPKMNTIDFLVSTKKNPNGDEYVGNMFKDGINISGNSDIIQYKTIHLKVGFDESKHGYLNLSKYLMILLVLI